MACMGLIVAIVSLGIVAGQTPIIIYRITEELPIGSLVGSISDAGGDHLDLTKDLVYTLVSQDTMFSVTGENIYTSVPIDRESVCNNHDCFVVIGVLVTEVSGPFEQQFTVHIYVDDINDNSPIFPMDSFTLSVSEGVPPGTMYDMLQATDSDTGGTNSVRTYLLMDTEYGNTFDILVDTNADDTSSVKLVVQDYLDRETRDMYIVGLVAVDGGGPAMSGTLTVTINVQDINDNVPVFEMDIYNISIPETTAINDTVVFLSAVDNDVGVNSEITFVLDEHQDGIDELSRLFYLESTSGDIYVNSDLRADADKTFQFVVSAIDGGTPPLSAHTEVTIAIQDTINDYAPNITGINNVLVIESAPLGITLAQLNVKDEDGGDNGRVSCSVSSAKFMIINEIADWFVVSSHSAFDREVTDLYTITVTCEDKGYPIKYGATSIVIHVTDVNDNAPVFQVPIYTATIVENVSIGTEIMRVLATDADVGNNAVVHYAVHADALDRFIVDRASGVICVNSDFTHETGATIVFHVLANDDGEPSLTGSATVRVTIERDDRDDTPAASSYRIRFG